MSDIAAFLTAYADELEHGCDVLIGWHGPRVAPTVLEEKAWAVALRQLVAAHTWESDEDDGIIFDTDCEDCRQIPPCRTLRLLAAPYTNRPGYDPAWAPA